MQDNRESFRRGPANGVGDSGVDTQDERKLALPDHFHDAPRGGFGAQPSRSGKGLVRGRPLLVHQVCAAVVR